jgi:hypothetical protein
MTDLSPAAQAVLDAAYALPLRNNQPSIAAALRVVADQLINVKWSCEMWELHRDIHAIAAELENHQ